MGERKEKISSRDLTIASGGIIGTGIGWFLIHLFVKLPRSESPTAVDVFAALGILAFSMVSGALVGTHIARTKEEKPRHKDTN